jgi:hypothetical protein
MFNSAELTEAVDLQQRSYRLLKWVASAIRDGFINFDTAHTHSNIPDAAESWILGHFSNIPQNARPAREQITAFATMFTTYLENSFDLIANPGKRLYSEDAHCFCSMCSWLIDAPNLKPKKLTTRDKRRAMKLRTDAIKQLAIDAKVTVSDSQIDELLSERTNREDASLVAYGLDLLVRQRGTATGPAVLALWRGFAWNETGSPKPKFKFASELVLNAEKRLSQKLKNLGSQRSRGYSDNWQNSSSCQLKRPT